MEWVKDHGHSVIKSYQFDNFEMFIPDYMLKLNQRFKQ